MAHNFPLRALNVLISSVTLHLVLSVTENNDTLVLGRNLWIEHYKQRKWRRTLMFVHVCVCVCVCVQAWRRICLGFTGGKSEL